MFDGCELNGSSTAGFLRPEFIIHILRVECASSLEARAGCGKSARPESVRGVRSNSYPYRDLVIVALDGKIGYPSRYGPGFNNSTTPKKLRLNVDKFVSVECFRDSNGNR